MSSNPLDFPERCHGKWVPSPSMPRMSQDGPETPPRVIHISSSYFLVHCGRAKVRKRSAFFTLFVSTFPFRSVDDDALALLAAFCHDRLESLEVSDNGNVTDEGVASLRKLKKLRHLWLENLGGVDNPEHVLKGLRKELPSCHIEWPPFTDQSHQTD